MEALDEYIGRLLLVFVFVAAVGCLENDICVVIVVFNLVFSVDVWGKADVTKLDVTVELTADVTFCVVSAEVDAAVCVGCSDIVVSIVEDLVGESDTVELWTVEIGLTVLVNGESGWLVVESVIIVGMELEIEDGEDSVDGFVMVSGKVASFVVKVF